MTFIPTLKLGKPHGLKGGVKATLLASSPEVLEYPHSTEDGTAVTLTKVQPSTQGGLIIYVEGITTPEAAEEKLRGQILGVQEGMLPETEDDQIYLKDLLNLTVEDTNGTVVGESTGLGSTPAHDMLWITRKDGQKRMIPIHEEYIANLGESPLTLTELGESLLNL